MMICNASYLLAILSCMLFVPIVDAVCITLRLARVLQVTSLPLTL